MATKVKLRQKAISGYRHSLYLDFYPAIQHPKTGEPTRREFLGLYLLDKPKTPAEKLRNKEQMLLAEQIWHKRDNEISKPEIYTGYEKEQLRIKEMGERSFIDYFKELADKRKGSNNDNWISAYHHLVAFTKGKLKFNELSVKFCDDFKNHLRTTISIKSSKAPLSINTSASYFIKFKIALKQAYRYGFLQDNLNEKVAPIKTTEIFKNILTIDELNILAKTECPNPLLKRTAIFFALTGLPFKEMQNLEWGNIEVTDEFGIVINMIRQKTGNPYIVNIGEQAYELLGARTLPTDKVFSGLCNSDRYEYFQIWLAKAGIEKKLTFHDLRHTYGTNQIDAGTDIYTVQGNMSHSDIKDTQHYAPPSNKKKREAADRVKLNL